MLSTETKWKRHKMRILALAIAGSVIRFSTQPPNRLIDHPLCLHCHSLVAAKESPSLPEKDEARLVQVTLEFCRYFQVDIAQGQMRQ